MNTKNFEELLSDLNLKLFEQINSQTTENDKRSLLACQLAARNLLGKFTYLEIGSYLGGSIQPFLLDDRCERIVSIDKRPPWQADARGIDYVYQNNSTERMLENLKKLAPEKIGKITTIDGDASEIAPEKIGEKLDMCFIDGEHTDKAVFSDFAFCYKVLKSDGAILFHDAATVYNGLSHIIQFLEKEKVQFKAYNLPDIMFVIEFGDFPLHREPAIAEMLVNNHAGYLASLKLNDNYRQFANKPMIRKVRQVRAWLSGANVSK